MILKKKYIILGMIGCLCFGIGDWLLGYVDPTPIDGDIFYFIRAGHGADYDTLKAAVTLAFAVAGTFFLCPGLIHLADIAKDGKTAARLRLSGALCCMGWIMLHLTVTVNTAVFSEAAKIGGTELAVMLSNRLEKICLPVTYGSFLLVGAAFVLLIIDILRGKTALKKTAAVFAPVIPALIIAVISAVLPRSPFSYGLYTFNMNGGLLVWFAYLLTRAGKTDPVA